MKRRVLLELEQIQTGKDNAAKIEEIDKLMLSHITPKSFEGSKSVEIKYDKQFESSCLLISQKTGSDAKKMTVLQFYNALDVIKKQADAEAKVYKQHRLKKHGR